MLDFRQRSAALLMMLLAFSAGWLAAQEESTPTTRGGYLTVTYLGNEGLMLSAPGGKVLIDALFDDGLTGYEAVPARERRRLERAAPPYDDVGLVLATHFHGDHFDAGAVARYLSANTQARFVSTQQAVDQLRQHAGDIPGFDQRVVAADPAAGESIDLTAGGLELEILRITHGSRRPPVQNLGFLLEIHGLRLLHLGDSEADFDDLARYGLEGRGLDVAFVPFWYLLAPEDAETIARGIAAHTVVPIHVPASGAPASYFGGPGSREDLLLDLGRALPNVSVFQEPLETRRFALPEQLPVTD